MWPENRGCDKEWLLENIEGAAGVLVLGMVPYKVRGISIGLDSNTQRYAR